MTKDVLFSTCKNIATISLNRTKALNALSSAMMLEITDKLIEWQSTPEIQCIIIKHQEGKAFCAGGDIREIYSHKDSQEIESQLKLLRIEYRLVQFIARYPKPIIALIDGITFGGGAGLSLHASFVIATERSKFAMPEVKIGMIPDAGIDMLLSRMQNHFGMYLGLTGTSIKASELLQHELAHYYIKSERIELLISDLRSIDYIDQKSLTNRLYALCQDRPENGIFTADQQNWISNTFNQETISQIIHQIKQDSVNLSLSTDLRNVASDAYEHIKVASPTALFLTHKILRQGPLNLEEALQQNYKFAQLCIFHGDFYEGIRALLIDKDTSPQWLNSDYSILKKLPKQKLEKLKNHPLRWISSSSTT